jgi:hypothetical protein
LKKQEIILHCMGPCRVGSGCAFQQRVQRKALY